MTKLGEQPIEPGSTTDELRQAVGSLIDIVEEMAGAMRDNDKPEREWVNMVYEVLAEHRRKLGLRR